MKVCI